MSKLLALVVVVAGSGCAADGATPPGDSERTCDGLPIIEPPIEAQPCNENFAMASGTQYLVPLTIGPFFAGAANVCMSLENPFPKSIFTVSTEPKSGDVSGFRLEVRDGTTVVATSVDVESETNPGTTGAVLVYEPPAAATTEVTLAISAVDAPCATGTMFPSFNPDPQQ